VLGLILNVQQIETDKATGKVKESLRQIACADIVLLNKSDLASSETLSRLESMIISINPTAPIKRTVKGQLDLAAILGLGAYSAKSNFYDSALSGPAAEHNFHSTHPNDSHVHDEHCSHLNDISSLQIPVPILLPTQLEQVDKWVRTILWEGRIPGRHESGTGEKLEVLRCKGVWSTAEGRTFVLQGVRSLYETTEMEKSNVEDVKSAEGKIVLIGRGLDSSVYDSLTSILKEM